MIISHHHETNHQHHKVTAMQHQNTPLTNNENGLDSPARDVSAPSVPVFDPLEFENDLTSMDVSEEQRIEFLRILWEIMVACVDMGWGIEPTQAVCGKLIKTAFEEACDSQNTLESEEIHANDNHVRDDNSQITEEV